MKWSEKKNPFKVGDRVLVEWNSGVKNKGTITSTDAARVHVESDTSILIAGGDWLHWRQCKKLVKKKKAYPKEPWVNVYLDYTITYPTRAEADKFAMPNRITCIRHIPAKGQKK